MKYVVKHVFVAVTPMSKSETGDFQTIDKIAFLHLEV